MGRVIFIWGRVNVVLGRIDVVLGRIEVELGRIYVAWQGLYIKAGSRVVGGGIYEYVNKFRDVFHILPWL